MGFPSASSTCTTATPLTDAGKLSLWASDVGQNVSVSTLTPAMV